MLIANFRINPGLESGVVTKRDTALGAIVTGVVAGCCIGHRLSLAEPAGAGHDSPREACVIPPVLAAVLVAAGALLLVFRASDKPG
jgi:hypothetical protein